MMGKKSETDVGQSDVEAKNSGRESCREDAVVSVKSERELGRNEAGLSVGGKLSGLFIQGASKWLDGRGPE